MSLFSFQGALKPFDSDYRLGMLKLAVARLSVRSKVFGGVKWTRTTDLPLIRRTL